MKLPFDNEERERMIFNDKQGASKKLFLTKQFQISFYYLFLVSNFYQ